MMEEIAKTCVVRLACVPEQVNIPVYMVEKTIGEAHDIKVKVVSVPEGTGRMLELLERGEVDIAMTVSDAFIVAKSKGRAVELAGVWVHSPLVWAIAASPSLPAHVKTLSDLMQHRRVVTGQVMPKLRVGISRPGSGSQTMASYMAMLHGLDFVNGLEFIVANNIQGLLQGIQNDLFDVFLWETFTTKPYFDRQELRQIGDVPTPWPAFSLVTSESLSPELAVQMKNKLYPALSEAAATFTWDSAAAINLVTQRFNHKAADAATWLSRVQYNDATMKIDQDVWARSVDILKQVGLVPADFTVATLWQGNLLADVVTTAAGSGTEESLRLSRSPSQESNLSWDERWTERIFVCHPSSY